MLFVKFLMVCLGVFYCFQVYRSLSADRRQGWVVRSIGFTHPLFFYPAVFNDAFAGLSFIWLGFCVQNFLYGRITIMLIAHMVFTLGILCRFTDEEDRNWYWVGMPFCLLLGSYFYYLGLVEGVSFVDILDMIAD